MARQSKLNVQLATGQDEESILRELPVPLTLDERVRLRAIFKEPAFVKAWKNAKTFAPGPNPSGLNAELGDRIAVNRLHEMRGWVMFEAAILRQVEDPPLKAVKVVENYPDSGVNIVQPKSEPKK